MKLQVIDRIHLINIVPQKGTWNEISVGRVLTRKLEFTDVEHEALRFKAGADGKGLNWDAGKAKKCDKDISITTVEADLFKGILQEMDVKKELTSGYADLYEYFVLDKKADRFKSKQPKKKK